MNEKNVERVKILPIGGWGKLIANMTAIAYNKSLILIDAGKGLQIPAEWSYLSPKNLSRVSPTFPQFKVLEKYIKDGYKVEAMFLTHIHGDHMAGIQQLWKYLETLGVDRTTYPLYCTKFTNEFGKKSVPGWSKVQWIELINEGTYHLNFGQKVMELQSFLLMHSSLHSTALYFKLMLQKEKKILFLPDHRIEYDLESYNDQIADQYRVDQLLNKFLDQHVDVVIMESTTVGDCKEPELIATESAVCNNLKNLIGRLNSQAQTIFVSTYSTNPLRLKAILDVALKCNRKLAIYGRSMWNGYVAGQKCNLFSEQAMKNVVKLQDIKPVCKAKKSFIVLTTGHMGESNAALNKLLRNEQNFNWSKKDKVVLSSDTIPKEGPIYCRSFLRCNLLGKRIGFYLGDDYKNLLHTSGHIKYNDYVMYFKKWRDKKVSKVLLNHGDRASALKIYPLLEQHNLCADNIYIPRDGQTIYV